MRHQHEFANITQERYEQMAEEFLTGILPAGVRQCTRRSNGDLVRFDPRTLEFGVVGANGFIKTYLICNPLPSDNLTPEQYFERQCRN